MPPVSALLACEGLRIMLLQVQASESLLKLVAEMKLAVALGDFEGMNQGVDSTVEELSKR